MPGEIRLQWWRDVLERAARGRGGGPSGRGGAAATLARYRLPPELLLDLIEAHRFDLYDDPMATLAELERYAVKTPPALIVLAASILGDGRTEIADRHAGIAYAIAAVSRCCRVTPRAARCYLPLDLLQRYGAHAADVFATQASPAIARRARRVAPARRRHLTAHCKSSADCREVWPALCSRLALPAGAERDGAALRISRFGRRELPPWRRQWRCWRGRRDRPNGSAPNHSAATARALPIQRRDRRARGRRARFCAPGFCASRGRTCGLAVDGRRLHRAAGTGRN